MSIKDLKIDEITNDLIVENFDFVLISGIEKVIQQLKIRLQFFYAEWFLDTSMGVRFYTDVNLKQPDLAAIEALFRDTIIETPDVNSITYFELDFNRSLRKLNISFAVDTAFGIAEISEVF